MGHVLQQVAKSQIMSLLNGFFCYNQIRMKKVEKYKTTFNTHYGMFYYEQMPFGLINVGATFYRAM